MEHLSLPDDPASRRLFGVPIVATVSEAAGVGHVLATDAVVVDTDSQGVGVQWSETSNSDDFAIEPVRIAGWRMRNDQRKPISHAKLLVLENRGGKLRP